MFENFKKIKIKGGYFDEETELTLFYKAAVSVVYGRNGSGKTTIAHCIKQLALPDEEKNPEYTVSSDAAITDEVKPNVFVFDEDFVTEQVKFKADGIQTIVMLGEQVDLDKQIEKKEKELNDKEKELADLSALKEKYENAADVVSPGYYFNKIRDGLREDGGWADIDRDAKGNTLKSRVTSDVVYNLLKIEEPKASYEELHDQLMADLKLYLESENAEVIAWEMNDSDMPDDLSALKALLDKQVDAPKLNEREQRLINILATHPQHSTHQTRQMLAEGLEFCPLCLREISTTDAEAITATLSRILNEEADKYGKLLEDELARFADITQPFPTFPGDLHKTEVNEAQVAQEKLNKVLALVRGRIDERKRRIYEELPRAITTEMSAMYIEAVKEWRNSIAKLGRRVKSFNNTVTERNKLYDRIRNSNNILARKQLAAQLDGYRQAEANRAQNVKDIETKTGERDKSLAELKELKAKKENTKIALDYINDELGYVFYSDRRLKLVAGDDNTYKLKVNGRNVKPNKISVGERNVLALCYFFAKMFKDKTKVEKYKKEYLLVIDDPVSSFDYGNRLGVMTLLRYQFGSLLKGNANSRILVMSHDLHTVFDLLKVRNELCAAAVKSKKAFLELENKQLGGKQRDGEYWKLLKHVYDYAVDSGDDDPDDRTEMGIGNIMRRMLEAFASFCYAKTFEEMLRMEVLQAAIPEKKRVYYGNFMCRLALNGESHEEESVYALDTVSHFFTRKEKVQTAKSVLLFLLYVNRAHLASYLEDEIATIESWKSEEDNWIKMDGSDGSVVANAS